jgi:hypothetical protein
VGVTRVTHLVSHVDKVLLTVPEHSDVSGCNKSNTSGVTRGQGTVTRVTRLVSHVNKVLLTVPEHLVVSGCNKSNTSGVTRGQGTVT